jgi:hypothetical protein
MYVIVINMPNTEIATPATADLLCSVFRLAKPRIIPNTLVTPPQTGMIAIHKLSNPKAGEAIAKNFAYLNSGSRLVGSVSIWYSKRAIELYSPQP